MVAIKSGGPFGSGRIEGDLPGAGAGRERTERGGQAIEAGNREHALVLRLQSQLEPGGGAFEKAAGGARIDQDGVALGKLALDLVGLDGVLGEAGAAGLVGAGGALPFGDRVLHLVDLEQLELAGVLGEEAAHHRRHHRFAAGGDWNTNAERVEDLVGFAQEDVENGAVHGIVAAVEQDRADFRSLLSEPVAASFPLFEAVRVPRKVVVDDGVELLL
jgi:hypothetical protein